MITYGLYVEIQLLCIFTFRFHPKLQVAKAYEDTNNDNDDEDDDGDDDNNNRNCGRTKATDKQKAEHAFVKRLDCRQRHLAS